MIKEWILRQRIRREISINEPAVKKHKKGIRAYFRHNFRPLGKSLKWSVLAIYKPFKILNKLPFPIIFGIFLSVMLTGIFIANKLTYSYWGNSVLAACPELTTGAYDEQGSIVAVSPLDKVMSTFIGRSRSRSYSQAGVLMFIFVTVALQNFRPRKPQVYY